MAKTVPLIRAVALKPFLDWMLVSGIPVAERLAECHLDGYPWHAPDAPVPFNPAVRFIAVVAIRDGVPDFGCRSASARTAFELGLIGEVAGQAYTPLQAIEGAASLMPNYCTHLKMAITKQGDQGTFIANFEGSLDPLGLHLAHQHCAMAVKLLAEGGTGRSALTRVEIVPPPGGSVAALESWFRCEVVPSRDKLLRLHFRPGVLDRPVTSTVAGPVRVIDREVWRSLYDKSALVDATRWMADGLLVDRRPTVASVARTFGLSVRTLQRLLAEAGTSFNEVLDDVRRSRALRELRSDDMPIGQIAAGLGYAGQSSLTRAVRRWASHTPRHVRATRT